MQLGSAECQESLPTSQRDDLQLLCVAAGSHLVQPAVTFREVKAAPELQEEHGWRASVEVGGRKVTFTLGGDVVPDAALMAHLEATIADKIAIANPKWR